MKSNFIKIFCPSLAAFGGTETHIIQVSRLLASHGYRVTLLALRSNLRRESLALLKNSKVKYMNGRQPLFLFSLFSNQNVLYTNSTGNACPYLWKLKGDMKQGFHHVHTSAAHEETQYWSPAYRHFLISRRLIVTCSETTKHNLESIGAKGTIRFLPYLNGIIQTATNRQTKTISSRPIRFGFIGRIEPAKGIDIIINAIKSSVCQGIEWHFFGDGASMTDLRQLQLENVTLHGAFNAETDLKRIHSEIDAVVLPSYHSEGMPLCLAEAMSSGLPWISTDRGGTKELVGDLKDCFVNSVGDADAFIRSCNILRNRIANGKIDTIAITERYETHFSFTSASKRWLSFFNELTAI